MSTEAIRKRKEREEKRKAARAAKHAAEAEEADVEDEDGVVDDLEPTTLTVSSGSTVTPSKTKDALFPPQLPATLSKPLTFSNPSSLPYVITIPASSSSLEWYSPKQASAIYHTLASARKAGIWTYPSTLPERARCGVFKDLWHKGYFMGGGIKFGGEYLIYPGMSIFEKCTVYLRIAFRSHLFVY